MSATTDKELLRLTEELLQAIAAGDWATYEQLCDPSLSAFEPEACGHLVEGLRFHKYYFDLARDETPASQTTIVAPHVRLVGQDAAVVSYIRLIQHVAADGRPATACFEETRVWQRQHGSWRHVHFHRSRGSV
jgi:calcium/calmodulin-dependent protein kinase (CaM kinase) II